MVGMVGMPSGHIQWYDRGGDGERGSNVVSGQCRVVSHSCRLSSLLPGEIRAATTKRTAAVVTLRSPHIFESSSASMRDALAQLRRYAARDHACLLLEGERGCGKTILARHAHELSPRRGRTFRAISLAAADDALVSSDLFGHAKGAFTGADSARAGAIAS